MLTGMLDLVQGSIRFIRHIHLRQFTIVAYAEISWGKGSVVYNLPFFWICSRSRLVGAW